MEKRHIQTIIITSLALIGHLEEKKKICTGTLAILYVVYRADLDLITDLGGYITIAAHSDEIKELEKLHHCDLSKNPYL